MFFKVDMIIHTTEAPVTVRGILKEKKKFIP